jgi:hypothetical protein
MSSSSLNSANGDLSYHPTREDVTEALSKVRTAKRELLIAEKLRNSLPTLPDRPKGEQEIMKTNCDTLRDMLSDRLDAKQEAFEDISRPYNLSQAQETHFDIDSPDRGVEDNVTQIGADLVLEPPNATPDECEEVLQDFIAEKATLMEDLPMWSTAHRSLSTVLEKEALDRDFEKVYDEVDRFLDAGVSLV